MKKRNSYVTLKIIGLGFYKGKKTDCGYNVQWQSKLNCSHLHYLNFLIRWTDFAMYLNLYQKNVTSGIVQYTNSAKSDGYRYLFHFKIHMNTEGYIERLHFFCHCKAESRREEKTLNSNQLYSAKILIICLILHMTDILDKYIKHILYIEISNHSVSYAINMNDLGLEGPMTTMIFFVKIVNFRVQPKIVPFIPVNNSIFYLSKVKPLSKSFLQG